MHSYELLYSGVWYPYPSRARLALRAFVLLCVVCCVLCVVCCVLCVVCCVLCVVCGVACWCVVLCCVLWCVLCDVM